MYRFPNSKKKLSRSISGNEVIQITQAPKLTRSGNISAPGAPAQQSHGAMARCRLHAAHFAHIACIGGFSASLYGFSLT